MNEIILERWRDLARKAYEAERLAEAREKILSEMRDSGLSATVTAGCAHRGGAQ